MSQADKKRAIRPCGKVKPISFNILAKRFHAEARHCRCFVDRDHPGWCAAGLAFELNGRSVLGKGEHMFRYHGNSGSPDSHRISSAPLDFLALATGQDYNADYLRVLSRVAPAGSGFESDNS